MNQTEHIMREERRGFERLFAFLHPEQCLHCLGRLPDDDDFASITSLCGGDCQDRYFARLAALAAIRGARGDAMTTKGHAHFCLACGVEIGRGGDGCEIDHAHDFALCDICASRAREDEEETR